MQKEKILFISDLDGTLLNENSRLNQEGAQLINELIANDQFTFTFATARDFVSVKKVIPEIKLRHPIITANGAFILNPITEEILYGSYFNEKEEDHLQDIFCDYDAQPIVYAHHNNQQPTVAWVSGRETEGMLYYLTGRKNDPRLRPLEAKDCSKRMDGKVYCINLMDEKKNLEMLHKRIKETGLYYTIFHQELYREEWWLSIYPQTTNKGLSALKLKEQIKADRLIVFGDHTNDIPLFKVADEAYAVSNGHEELKKQAKYTIGKNTENAVPKWIMNNYKRLMNKEQSDSVENDTNHAQKH